MSYKNINGIKFHTQEMGKKGSPVIMLHGLFVGSMTTWFFTTAPFIKKKKRVMLYDLRGHGKTEKTPTGYNLDTMANDLEILTSNYTDQPVILIGHSYGALIALRFAQTYPNRVKQMVLVEAPLPPFQRTEVEDFLNKGHDYLIKALPETIQKFILFGSRKTKRLLHTLQFLKEESSLIDELCSEPPLLKQDISSVKTPTLCIYGTESKCLNDGHKLTAMLNNAEIKVLKGGHYLHLDNTKQLNQLILDFIE